VKLDGFVRPVVDANGQKKTPQLLNVLDELMADESAGDPISGLKWTHKLLAKLQAALAEQGYPVSQPTISRLLYARNYSLRVNRKRVAGKQTPGRDELSPVTLRRLERLL
jgi:hypothetical protein